MKKFVFLDVDGVLNREDKRRTYDYDYPIEPELAQRVGRLVAQLDAQVVISSDWRHFYDLSELRRVLDQFGAITPERVLGTTHIPQEQGDGIRGQEIATWLKSHGQPARVAILDDNHLGRFNMDGVRKWFVKTNPQQGVSEANIERATTLLTTGPVWARARAHRLDKSLVA